MGIVYSYLFSVYEKAVLFKELKNNNVHNATLVKLAMKNDTYLFEWKHYIRVLSSHIRVNGNEFDKDMQKHQFDKDLKFREVPDWNLKRIDLYLEVTPNLKKFHTFSDPSEIKINLNTMKKEMVEYNFGSTTYYITKISNNGNKENFYLFPVII